MNQAAVLGLCSLSHAFRWWSHFVVDLFDRLKHSFGATSVHAARRTPHRMQYGGAITKSQQYHMICWHSRFIIAVATCLSQSLNCFFFCSFYCGFFFLKRWNNHEKHTRRTLQAAVAMTVNRLFHSFGSIALIASIVHTFNKIVTLTIYSRMEKRNNCAHLKWLSVNRWIQLKGETEWLQSKQNQRFQMIVSETIYLLINEMPLFILPTNAFISIGFL